MAAVRSSAALTRGLLDQKEVDMLVDSGSSISLIQESVATAYSRQIERAPKGLELTSAEGKEIPVLGCITLPLCLGKLRVNHNFVVVHSLISPVILGIDFLQKYNLVLDFTSTPVGVTSKTVIELETLPKCMKPIVDTGIKVKICAVQALEETTGETIDSCAVPLFGKAAPPVFDVPTCTNTLLLAVLEQHKKLFSTTPGHTELAEHFIPTTGTPVKVPPRRIPANYRVEVEEQIQAMLEEGIIEESSSPWMSPAVFVRKKNGDVRICVDYRALNKQTIKDAYPLPRPDEVQDRLAGCTIFSTLDLRSGYWQLPVHKEDQAKTAFCPGPGLGLFQFRSAIWPLRGASFIPKTNGPDMS